MRSSFSLTGYAVIGLVALGTMAPQTAHAQLNATHVYDLNGTYADSLGGESLTPNGGTLGPTGYTFGAGQGLSLVNSINASNYSIELLFTFNQDNNYRRILDFKNGAGDTGLYFNSGILTFYVAGGGTVQGTLDVAAGTPVNVVVTRDSSSSLFAGYVNGIQQFTFTDSGNLGVFSEPNAVAKFFQDNTSGSNQQENSSGFADRIRIYNTALTAPQVASLSGASAAAPEPGSIALALTAGLPVIGIARRRKKR